MRLAASFIPVWVLGLGACSGDPNSSSGGSGGSGSTLPQAIGWDTCPSSFEPTDAEAWAVAHAGSYVFVPTAGSCSIDGETLVLNQAYPLTIAAAPARISVASGNFTWDGTDDLACAGSSTSALEIGWVSGFARAGFIGTKPSSLLIGFCLGDLRLP